ncbi:uroporphyrinogen decarboxylase [Halospina sp. K52047b]|uniref:uroporphyrinogen decarboxylase n=1 Tax=Halospina sp. K52047b TaxID=2614160 RepID=UPI00124AB2F4|nr:uroporphyrinogen decarboxylase [Halospina sp. K52047b]KAA8982510.1 uroporphyrinogen decarboxylase [Halospina sp. K52047b]
MTPLQNDRLLRAIAGEPVDATPVWMMRQAGRYLPEYRRVREQAGSFMALCQDDSLACEVTLQPLERFDLDAAILFSDILTIPDAMDLGLHFVTGEGPRFRKTVTTAEDVAALPELNAERDLGYVMNAVSTIRRELNGRVPLIGFAGSPWTLATYMVEGGSSKDFRGIKRLMMESPEVLHGLLGKLADAVTDYLNAQIRAGAQVVQIFDTWGGALSPQAYRAFSLDYMQRIIDGLIRENDGRQVPVIVFTKNGGQWLETMAGCGADCLGLDWTTHIGEARQRVGDQVALQGNLDPSTLYAPDDVIRSEVERILGEYGTGPGHVFNLGHGVHLDVDPDKAKVMVDAVHEFSAR